MDKKNTKVAAMSKNEVDLERSFKAVYEEVKDKSCQCPGCTKQVKGKTMAVFQNNKPIMKPEDIDVNQVYEFVCKTCGTALIRITPS